MPDNLFDNFVGDKLNDHEAPVPAGLWDKLVEKQLDGFIGEKLKDHEAPVPEGLWDKIADAQLDNYFRETLSGYAAPVPEGAWDKVTDAPLDQFFSEKLSDHIAPVPAGAWDKVRDGQFDQFMSDKLGNYTASVPAGLWEKIHPEEKERRVIFWWRLPVAASLILAVLLGGAMGAYFWLKPQKNSTDKTVVISTPSQGNSTTNTPANKKQDEAAKETSPATADGAVPAQQGINDEASANRVNDVKENASTRNNVASLPLSNSSTSTSSQKINKGRSSIGGHDTPFLPAADKGIVDRQSIPPAGTNTDHDAVNKTDDNNVAASIPFTLFSPGQTHNSSLKNIRLDQHQELSDNGHTSKFRSNVICPTNRRSNSDWYVELYTSPDLAFKSVTNNSASAQYLQKKDSSEHMNVGFTAGARIVKPITENIWLKTGVQYTQMNERYLYRSENEIKTTTVVTVRTIIRAPGDTVVVSDTSVLQTAGYKNVTVRNRYRSIDIPLTIGYQFPTEGDLRIGVNAGVIFNLSSWYQGVILDSSLAVVPLTKSNSMVYKQKLGLGLYAGISVSKQLGEGMQVFFEPYFRYNLSNMTSAQSPFNQKFSLGGLAVGLRFNLNRQ